MPQGISIHIAVPEPAAGCGAGKSLDGVVAAPYAMAYLAARAGFAVRPLILGASATIARVVEEITWAATALAKGDILLLTFAGHGCRYVVDSNVLSREDDYYNEAWNLSDEILINDVLYGLWTLFAEGVRIVVVSESCHSESIGSFRLGAATSGTVPKHRPRHKGWGAIGWTVRALFQMLNQRSSRTVIDLSRSRRFERIAAHAERPLVAQVIVLAATKDNRKAPDNTPLPYFTEALLSVWNWGEYSATGSYEAFMREIAAIVDRTSPRQEPRLTPLTGSGELPSQRPFTI